MTFIALAHLVDAISALILGNPIRLLQLYPIVGEKLQAVAPQTYFLTAIISSLIFWGITCTITFENPVEDFLNKILSDAKTQNASENQLLESKSEVLDVMFETVISSNDTLSQVKDLICNVRAEAKEIQPLKENIGKIREELFVLRKEIRRIDEKAKFPNLCPTCGKPLLPQFKMCPYCGENVGLLPKEIVSVGESKRNI